MFINKPKISFGLIVLNGEPFIRYCLRNLYPFAHEIIVVEGGSRNAADFAPEGHSVDGTLETLRDFKQHEDSANKLRIIRKDGFWNEKEEQSQAYAAAATGDYLWQIDVDEFYKQEDMERILEMLRKNPRITQMSFKTINFWGGPEFTFDAWHSRGGADIFHRLFKWGPGYQYAAHRPPRVCNERQKDLRYLHYVSGYQLARMGIFMYHYTMFFPRLVREKCLYHSKQAKNINKYKDIATWAQDVFMDLKHPCNVNTRAEPVSWLERFRGKHPAIILELLNDIKNSKVREELRKTEDIENLISRPDYIARKTILKLGIPLVVLKRELRRVIKKSF